MTRLLNDTRFVVREKAINECVRRGQDFLPKLGTYLSRGDIRVRRNCLRALLRLAQQNETSQAATDAILPALGDTVPSIRQFACRALGQSVADVSSGRLIPMLTDTDAAVRREAATSLGKLGDAKAVRPLIDALSKSVDRSEQHACLYALIQIDKPQRLTREITPHAAEKDPSLASALLIAIDQSDSGRLSQDQVVPLLSSENNKLEQTALRILVEHPDWRSATKKLLLSWLADERDLLRHRESAIELISRLANDSEVAQSIGNLVRSTQTAQVEAICLKALASTNDLKLHGSWLSVLRLKLASPDAAEVKQALEVVKVLKTNQFDHELEELAANKHHRPFLRLQALSAMTPVAPSEAMMELIHEILADQSSPNDAMHVARWLPLARPSPAQLIQFTTHFSSAPPSLLRELIRSYGRLKDVNQIDEFLRATGDAKSFLTLPGKRIERCRKTFSSRNFASSKSIAQSTQGISAN